MKTLDVVAKVWLILLPICFFGGFVYSAIRDGKYLELGIILGVIFVGCMTAWAVFRVASK